MTGLSAQTAARPRLRDRTLIWILVSAAVVLAAFFLLRPMLPDDWRQPGSVPLQSFAIAAALLFLVPVGFYFNKRTGAGGASGSWLAAHVSAAVVGTVLAVMHGAARFDDPPALLVLALIGLAATGATARAYLSRDMSATFGSKRRAFAGPDPALRAELALLIGRKRALLKRLDPDASEATFSVALHHWLRRPGMAHAYARLQRRESALIGARKSVGAMQAWWRPLHILLAYGLVLGLLTHIVTVLFFAGYVAGGREIYWWHFTAW